MAQPRSNSSKKTSSGGGTSRTGSAKSGTSGRSSSSKSGGSARKSYSGSRSHSTAAMKNVRLFKKQNGKWTLNWPVIIAFYPKIFIKYFYEKNNDWTNKKLSLGLANA